MGRVTQSISGAHGAALFAVLLLTALLFILISAMLITSGQEVLLAGLHRDAIRAEEQGQAGLEEVLHRLAGGRALKPGAVPAGDRCAHDDGSPGIRASLPAAGGCVVVLTRAVGPSGAFLEMRSDAEGGRARRRMSEVVLARTTTMVPGVLVLHGLHETRGVEIRSGVVHVHTSVRYAAATSAERTTYAGWRIGEDPGGAGGAAASCYTHTECATLGRPQWWPGHRRAVYPWRALRPDPLPGNPVSDPRVAETALRFECPSGPPAQQVSQTIGSDGPGFQSGDLRADLTPSDPQQAGVAVEPLYGCTPDGLPYSWLREAFDTEDDPDADPDHVLWFRFIRFDHWLARYACFDEAILSWMPCGGFHPDPARGDPSLGAVLPLLPGAIWAQNYDQRRTGGGPVLPADLDLGTCADPPDCRSPLNNRTVVALTGGTYTLFCPGLCPEGHGILYAGGDLTIAGSLTYRGAIVVDGALVIGAGGAATLFGPVSARRIANLGDGARFLTGDAVAIGVVGPSSVTRRAWWER